MAEVSAYPRTRSPLRPSPLSLLLAAVLAGGTISILPLFGVLSARRHEAVDLRAAPDVTHVPAPVARIVAPAEEREPERRPRPHVPARSHPSPRIPRVVAALPATALPTTALDLDIGVVALDLGFEVAGPSGPPRPGRRPPVPPVEKPPPPDREPVLLLRPDPHYPVSARRRGITGYVLLQVLIDEEGRVADTKVIASEPGTTFVSAARRGVKRWRYRPATRGGKPVPAWVRYRIRFELED